MADLHKNEAGYTHRRSNPQETGRRFGARVAGDGSLWGDARPRDFNRIGSHARHDVCDQQMTTP
jgi:hypothetical protein